MRIAMGVEYAGWKYAGFQRQNHINAVQNELERALSQIADETVELKCAGRTDTGVSATGQVIHFDVSKERTDRSWILGTNSLLPNDIAVTWAKHVSDDFHARFSAKARRYRYIMQNSDYKPAILREGIAWYRGDYDVTAMDDAAQMLLGENDFASFKSSQDENPHSMRNLQLLHVERRGRFIVFNVQANAFLHHMVRNLVGSLLPIGRGEKDKAWLEDIFRAKDRTLAGSTAQAEGLYLVEVIYDPQWQLPQRPEDLGPLWF